MSLYNRGKVKWLQDGVKVLGIHIIHDTKTLIAKNFNPLRAKIENLVKIWSMRNLSVFGRVAVIKAHLQSQLVYQLSVLLSPPKGFHQTVEKLLFKYGYGTINQTRSKE